MGSVRTRERRFGCVLGTLYERAMTDLRARQKWFSCARRMVYVRGMGFEGEAPGTVYVRAKCEFRGLGGRCKCTISRLHKPRAAALEHRQLCFRAYLLHFEYDCC